MPHYWEKHGNGYYCFTPEGMKRLNPEEPVCHVSYYEAGIAGLLENAFSHSSSVGSLFPIHLAYASASVPTLMAGKL